MKIHIFYYEMKTTNGEPINRAACRLILGSPLPSINQPDNNSTLYDKLKNKTDENADTKSNTTTDGDDLLETLSELDKLNINIQLGKEWITKASKILIDIHTSIAEKNQIITTQQDTLLWTHAAVTALADELIAGYENTHFLL